MSNILYNVTKLTKFINFNDFIIISCPDISVRTTYINFMYAKIKYNNLIYNDASIYINLINKHMCVHDQNHNLIYEIN